MTAEGGAGGTSSSGSTSLVGGAGGNTSQSYEGDHTSSILALAGGTGAMNSSNQNLADIAASVSPAAQMFGGSSYYGTAQKGMGGTAGSNNTSGTAGGDGCVIIEW